MTHGYHTHRIHNARLLAGIVVFGIAFQYVDPLARSGEGFLVDVILGCIGGNVLFVVVIGWAALGVEVDFGRGQAPWKNTPNPLRNRRGSARIYAIPPPLVLPPHPRTSSR